MNAQIGTIKEVKTVLSFVMMNSTRHISKRTDRNGSAVRAITWSDDTTGDINYRPAVREFSTEIFALLAWLSASACAATALLLFF
ncbi:MULTISPECIES: hypothetical protein [unclassified Chelatococcus]|uniref:hypothetical protein n=1 Tax=unclassified Chelatococcus TaxID=2638111 RepID=UPI001BCFB8E4|nr:MULTISPECIES: hypothetical protein [unclassified Chelatococcus]CAH1672477.1 conserved hypothetical protein [Hyphomicrobiales bacterium]MBS7738594.1 hypothetical protein [Chelatococcus sp. HY11]MBX3542998.1 hypothetical protein [Chelatococcus sp.]MCO5076876.1 hypothetical protein [Chelatococcus sp.]CAH1675279.1 conserved hypothetical protein [Hyphomicrobiales bacterium]